VTSTRRWIVACVAAGLLLRLAFGLFYWTGKPLTHDEREYLALGRSVARGDGFVYPADEPLPGTGQQFGRAPGYPVFLALLRVTDPADSVPARVKVAQAVVGTVGVWLIAIIAQRAAGSRAGIAAAAIGAIYPPLVVIPAYAMSETLYSTVALLAAATAMDLHGSSRIGRTVLFAVLTAIAILIRPAMLLFVPVAALWLVLNGSERRRVALTRAAVFAGVTIACIAPWTIRNARVYHRFIPLASEGGVTFWTGNHPLARGDGDLAANLPLKEAELEFRARHQDLTPEELEPLYYREALAWIRAHPGDWVALIVRKAFFTIVPIGPSYTLHSPRYVAASAGAYLALLLPAIPGAWLLWRRGQPPLALWLMAASTVFAGLIFFPQERFRIPVIDPALIVAASGLAAFRRHERTDRRSDV
jgi:Dolichyl-phosphate-mannose-protein mannosyltransferase